MKKLILVLLPLAFMLLVTPAWAGYPADSGNNLLEKCQNYDSNWNSYDGGFCMGFLFGAVNQAQSRFNPAEGRKMGPPLICMPSEVSFEQMRRIVVRWLNEHPEALHKSGTYLVIDALQETYPCKAR
jgi:hypothetical protein